MHERDGSQHVKRLATGFDLEAPVAFPRADMSKQRRKTTDAASQMLPPEEWRVEHPGIGTNKLQTVSLANEGSHAENPHRITVAAENESSRHRSFGADDASLPMFRIQQSH